MAFAAVAAPLIMATASVLANELTDNREKLRLHGEEQFRKEVVKVTDGVYVAVGYSASNVTLIQGTNGSIIVDTGSNPIEAKAAKDAFGHLLGSVQAIIYTHNHADHTGGAAVFASEGSPEIYSHSLLLESGQRIVRGRRDGGDQFGIALPASQFINAGIQRQYGRDVPHTRAGYLPPTKTFDVDQLPLSIAGVQLVLVHSPGETAENTAVWLPDKRTLLAGDNFYRAFPNLYPIRGTGIRPPQIWIDSLGELIELKADHLIPGHMRPVSGADEVNIALTSYRDGIESIYTQTLEGIVAGKRPDELVQTVKLPDRLIDSPYLQEYYGSIEWSVRAIYASTVGWFDGDAANMFPLSRTDRAKRTIDLAGGAARILEEARVALARGDYQWAAELGDHLILADELLAEARKIKAQALIELGEQQLNATARNYYLTSAQYLLESANSN